MQLNADILLALRYLRPKRTFISVITLLSILGPVLGVALLVIVISVMSGFDLKLKESILSMQAHLQIHGAYSPIDGSGQQTLNNSEPLLALLEELDCQGAPVIEGPALIQVRDRAISKYLRGIVPEQEKLVTGIADEKTFEGKFDIGEGEALIGREMAWQLGLHIGDRLLIHSPANLTRNFQWEEDGTLKANQQQEVYLPEEVTVAGIFNMGLYEYDTSVMLVHIDTAADLFGLEWGTATSIHAKTPDPFRLTPIVETIRERFPGVRVMSWQDANRRLFDALRVEKNLMFFLLTFIVIVAAFGIAGTLITVAVQKTREIGILKAVGMTPMLVGRIFIYQGAIIGTVGTTFGTGLGLVIIHFRSQISEILAKVLGVEIFPKELYHFSEIPARVVPHDVLVIAASALVLCMLASFVPALYASLLSPADALRDDN